MSEVKVVKGSTLLIKRGNRFVIGSSKGGIRAGQKRLRISGLGYRQCMYIPADLELVPVTVYVSKEVAELLEVDEQE